MFLGPQLLAIFWNGLIFGSGTLELQLCLERERETETETETEHSLYLEHCRTYKVPVRQDCQLKSIKKMCVCVSSSCCLPPLPVKVTAPPTIGLNYSKYSHCKTVKSMPLKDNVKVTHFKMEPVKWSFF